MDFNYKFVASTFYNGAYALSLHVRWKLSKFTRKRQQVSPLLSQIRYIYYREDAEAVVGKCFKMTE